MNCENIKKELVQIHMLPTEDRSNIAYVGENPNLLLNKDIKYSYTSYCKPQHLYFTTEEEIKKGDWYYSKLGGKYNQQIRQSNYNRGIGRKIIATTDTKLMHLSNNGRVGFRLPQPSQSFVEKFCDVGGIDEVLIEYSLKGNLMGTYSEPRVNSDNEITVHPIKYSWNREEIIEIINKTIDKWSFEKDTGSLIRENWAKKMLKK